MVRWFPVLSSFALAVAGGCFLLVAVSHIFYPGFTEPMEGDVLQHVERAAHGRVIYPAPGPEYIALAYMPLYYVFAAPFYLVFGDSLSGPRLLSVLCAVASAILVGRIAGRETGSRATAVLAAAFFCAGYRAMDACLFCALPDSLLLFWLLLGYWFWAYGTTRGSDLLWLVCFTLAFWTKQHGAFFFGGAVLYALLFRKNALPRGVIFAGIVLGGPIAYLVVGQMLGERFIDHTLTIPGKWDHSWWFSLRRTAFVAACIAPLALVAAFELVRRAWRSGEWRPTPLGWFTIAALAAAMVTMTAAGSSNNHYVPFLAMLAIVLAVLCNRLRNSVGPSRLSWPLLAALLASAGVTYIAVISFGNHAIPIFVPVALALAAPGVALIDRSALFSANRGLAVATLMVIAQFAICYYSPARYLPRAGWRDSMARLNDELSRLDGPVIWVTYGRIPSDLLPRNVARAPSWVALEDIERQVDSAEPAERDLAPFRDRVRNGHGLYLLSDDPIENIPVWNKLGLNVTLERDFGDAFAPVRQIADHWYGSGGPPRYLYRVR